MVKLEVLFCVTVVGLSGVFISGMRNAINKSKRPEEITTKLNGILTTYSQTRDTSSLKFVNGNCEYFLEDLKDATLLDLAENKISRMRSGGIEKVTITKNYRASGERTETTLLSSETDLGKWSALYDITITNILNQRNDYDLLTSAGNLEAELLGVKKPVEEEKEVIKHTYTDNKSSIKLKLEF